MIGLPPESDSAARKRTPMFSGLIAYFPDALAEVAALSFEGNEKHNPGEPLHWARGKSTDQTDCVVRHMADYSKAASLHHKVQCLRAAAWRTLAQLQLDIEALQFEESL